MSEMHASLTLSERIAVSQHSPDHRNADRIPRQRQRELNIHRTPPGSGMSPGVGFPVKSGLTAKSRCCYLLLASSWHCGTPEPDFSPSQGISRCQMCRSTAQRARCSPRSRCWPAGSRPSFGRPQVPPRRPAPRGPPRTACPAVRLTTPEKPSLGSARAMAWPCGSRISGFSMTSTMTRATAFLLGAAGVGKASLPASVAGNTTGTGRGWGLREGL